MANTSQLNGLNQDLIVNDQYNLAASEIYQSFGHIVRSGRKSLFKFGRGSNLGTSETDINFLSRNEVYVTTNSITTLSSSNAGDTAIIRVEGMTIDAAGVTSFCVQQVTLNGQSKVLFTTPLFRCTRLRNAGTTKTLGDVYVYEDGTVVGGIPSNLDLVHNVLSQFDQTTLRAATTIASSNYFLINKIYASVAKKASASADIRFKSRKIGNNYFTTKFVIGVDNSNSLDMHFHEPIIIEPNTDLLMTAVCSTTGVDVSAGFIGYFADIV